MAGKLYGVGVGPGDPELLTMKAMNRIKDCDVIAIPSGKKESCVAYTIVQAIYPEISKKNCILLDYPMTKDKFVLEQSHQNNAAKVVNLLEEGLDVAFLTLGDPTIYSTYMYLHHSVASQGYDTEIINGVPSFLAAAATLGISLAEQDEEIHIIPATYGVKNAKYGAGTQILMKAGRKLEEIKKQQRLEQEQTEKSTFLAMIEKCGMQGEQIAIGIENIPDHAGYYTTVIIKNKEK